MVLLSLCTYNRRRGGIQAPVKRQLSDIHLNAVKIWECKHKAQTPGLNDCIYCACPLTSQKPVYDLKQFYKSYKYYKGNVEMVQVWSLLNHSHSVR